MGLGLCSGWLPGEGGSGAESIDSAVLGEGGGVSLRPQGHIGFQPHCSSLCFPFPMAFSKSIFIWPSSYKDTILIGLASTLLQFGLIAQLHGQRLFQI